LATLLGDIHTKGPSEKIPIALEKNIKQVFTALIQSFPDVKEKLESELKT